MFDVCLYIGDGLFITFRWMGVDVNFEYELLREKICYVICKQQRHASAALSEPLISSAQFLYLNV